MSTVLRVLIADDEALARERLRALLADLVASVPNEVAGEAADGMQALALFPECGAEIALVDIHMPGMSGIELARHLQGLERPPAVVFVTAHDQYAIQAFEVNAIDYLLKPVRAARLEAALRKAAGGARASREQLAVADPGARRFLGVPERGRVTLVPVGEILYLKAEQKYTVVHTRAREYLIEEPLSQLEHEFAGTLLRIHRNCLVARHAIRGAARLREPSVDAEGELHWGVVLEGHVAPLPVSRRQWASVKALLKE
ncbi:MAG: response regulator transcription factor [Burkholderiales bacterium]|nr:response regulator transcription factor [Burkholderiales bacterium]